LKRKLKVAVVVMLAFIVPPVTGGGGCLMFLACPSVR